MKIYFDKKINCWVGEFNGKKKIVPNWTSDKVAFKPKEKNMLDKEQIETLIEEKKSYIDKLSQREQDYIDSIISDTRALEEIRDNISASNDLIVNLETMLKECEE